MKNILIVFFLLFSISGFSQVYFECANVDISRISKCEDCGGGVSKASFSGVRFFQGKRIIKEISFPFQVNMMSAGLVCVKELADNGEVYCFDRSQTSYTYTNDIFNALLECQESVLNGTEEGTNIYNSNDELTENRLVEMNDNSLTLNNGDFIHTGQNDELFVGGGSASVTTTNFSYNVTFEFDDGTNFDELVVGTVLTMVSSLPRLTGTFTITDIPNGLSAPYVLTGTHSQWQQATGTFAYNTTASFIPNINVNFDAQGYVQFSQFGQGINTATNRSKTASGYYAGFATDGTILEVTPSVSNIYTTNGSTNGPRLIELNANNFTIESLYNATIFFSTENFARKSTFVMSEGRSGMSMQGNGSVSGAFESLMDVATFMRYTNAANNKSEFSLIGDEVQIEFDDEVTKSFRFLNTGTGIFSKYNNLTLLQTESNTGGNYTRPSTIPYFSDEGIITESENYLIAETGYESGQKQLVMNLTETELTNGTFGSSGFGLKTGFDNGVLSAYGINRYGWGHYSYGTAVTDYRNRFSGTHEQRLANTLPIGVAGTEIYLEQFRFGSDIGEGLIGQFTTELGTVGGTPATSSLDFKWKSYNSTGPNISTDASLIFSLQGEEQTATLNQYGTGTKDAATLGKTESTYLTGYATDGTLIEVEMGGSFADDTAAGVGGVAVGELYFNTTTGKLKTRMT